MRGRLILLVEFLLVFILAISMVDISYAGTVKSTDNTFQVLYPDDIAVTKPYKVQIKITSRKLQKKANVINTHGCYIMDSYFEDEDLKAKMPPVGQRGFTEYLGAEIVTLELATYPFASSVDVEYDGTCKIEFLECRDDCSTLGFKLDIDEAEFPIVRDDALMTNLVFPTSYDKEFTNFKEGILSVYNKEGQDGSAYLLDMHAESYPYNKIPYGEKFNLGSEDDFNEYVENQISDPGYQMESGVKYNANTGKVAYYFPDSHGVSYYSNLEPEKEYDVESNLGGIVYYPHFEIHINLRKSENALGKDAPAVKGTNDAELMEILKSFTLVDGTTDYDGEFEDVEERIDYKEEKKEPMYPLYDPFFDYDGDGMLNDYEYADYYAVESERLRYFDANYDDSEKIEYKESEPTEETGEPKVRQSDLVELFAQANRYEGAILQKSDVIVSEVKNVKEDIDKITKRINAMESSFKILAKDAVENKEALDDLLEKIRVSRDELDDKAKLQTNMIKSIDKEYSVLLKKLDKDISMAEDDDTKMVLEDKRKAILDNAKYAKINAYFHSGNDAEFEKFAKKYQYDVDSKLTSKISLLVGLKKLEKGMPQSALHDFKSAMASDPNNPMARELTNKIEGAYLDGIEAKLMAEMQGDLKAYNKANQVGEGGTVSYVGDLLTTGIASSAGALFGYEEAKALESNILQTEVSKQIAGIKITKALMGSGMTLKEVKALEKPEDFQKLAEKYGKTITLDQAKKYREMVQQANNNPDVESISRNSVMPLIVESGKSYYKNNYDKDLVSSVLDVVNVKNVIITLGPSAVFTYGGEVTTTKEFIRGVTKIDKIQKALMTTKLGNDATKTGRLLSWASTRLGQDLKTISQYGDARKFMIGQGFGMVENEVVGKGAEFVLGKDKGKVFSDFYDGFMGFTGITDMGDLTNVAGDIDDSEFVDDFTDGIKKGIMNKEELIEGRNLMKRDLDEAMKVSNMENGKEARDKILKSLESKDKINDDVLDELQKEITKAKAILGESDSKVAMLKRTQLDSAEDAIKAYKNMDYDEAMKMAKKSGHMDDMITDTIDDIRIREKMSEKVLEIAEKAPDVSEKMTIKEMIAEEPLKVADAEVPMLDVDANTGKVTVKKEGSMVLEISINDNVPNKGWGKVVENADDLAKAVGFKTADKLGYLGAQDEMDQFSMKLLDLVVKKSVPDAMKTAVDTTTQEYVYVMDLPNSNSIIVKVQPEKKETEHEKRMAEVTDALVMTDTNFDRNVKKGKYQIIEDLTK